MPLKPSTPIEIAVLRQITAEQYDAVASLWLASGVANPARGDTLEAVQYSLAHGGIILIASEAGQPVGTAWLTNDFRRLYLHHMAVRPDRQNHGIGTKLMQQSVLLAGELKLQMKLEVNLANAAARHLYEQFGFALLEGYEVMIRREI